MRPIREILNLITTCAGPRGMAHLTPLPNEPLAERAIALAIVSAEREPFHALQQHLNRFFPDGIDAALIEDEPAATAAIVDIVAEHIRDARGRCAHHGMPPLDPDDFITLVQGIPAIARRAADLAFVQILGSALGAQQ